MDEEQPCTLEVSAILKDLVIVLTGSLTFKRSTFYPDDDHLADERETYFWRRCKEHAEMPANKEAIRRTLELCRNVLHGRTDKEPADVSDELIDYLESRFGLDLGQLRIRQGLDPEAHAKADDAVTTVRVVLKLCACRKRVSAQEIRDAVLHIRFSNTVENGSGSPKTSRTIERFIYDTIDFDAGVAIGAARRKLDIVQYRGPSWLAEHKDVLKRLLSNPDLHMRVGIVSPESAAFESFAARVGMPPQRVRHLIDIERETWDRLYREANSGGGIEYAGATFELVLHHAIPTKEFFRLDGRIIVLEVPGTPGDFALPGYECRASDGAIFESKEREIERLFESGCGRTRGKQSSAGERSSTLD